MPGSGVPELLAIIGCCRDPVPRLAGPQEAPDARAELAFAVEAALRGLD